MDLCKKVAKMGVKTIVYTDISKDGMMIGPNVNGTKEIVDATGVNIIASGGISTMVDIERIDSIGGYGVTIRNSLY